MASSVESCAKTIVDLSDASKITANEEILREILLDPEVKDKEVCVIAITGTFRQGKSFLLNFLLRYLKLKYKTKKAISEKWLDAADGNILGFSFKCGIDRHTTGILMWSEIFLAHLPSGKEIAIVLLDTQGTFDNQTTKQHCAAIFAISTLISSVQIFNLKDKINQYDLEHLECFSGYGQLAIDENSESRGKPFQNLCFLIRDWAYDFEFDYGTSGGQEFLKSKIHSEEIPPELKMQADNIIQIFENITCCLLPHPGRAVASNPSFKGELGDIDPKFIQCVEEFLPTILAPENLVPKTINGEAITVSDLFTFVQIYCQYFTSGEVPALPTMYMAAAEAQLKIALNEAEEIYKRAMDAIVDTEEALKDDIMEEHHVKQKQKAMEHFDSKRIIKNAEMKTKFRKLLEGTLETKFMECKRINRIKQEKEEQLSQQEKMFEKRQQDEKEKIQKLHDEKIQTQLEDLRNEHFKVERQLLEEKNKHDAEKHRLEIENLKQKQTHQEELQKKAMEVEHEKQKRFEDRITHKQEMCEERIERRSVEKEAEREAQIHKKEMKQMENRNSSLKTEKENLKKYNENLMNDVETLTIAAENAKKEKEREAREKETKEKEAREKAAKAKEAESGCIIG